MKIDVISLENKKVSDIELNDAIFSVEVRKDILNRVVNWQLAKRQAGTHKVKRRGELRITKAKPFRQKGTGNARQGFKGATQMRGGATVHGPVYRSHAHDLTKKFRKLGLKTALSAKVAEGNLIIVDSATLSTPSTKGLKSILSNLGWKNALVIDGESVNDNFALASRNIHGLDVLPQIGANVYDILKHEKLVLTTEAVTTLEGRL